MNIITAKKKQVKVGVGIVILQKGKILLGLRHKDPEKADSELHGEGTWSLPGGRIEFGESFENVCAREVYEECGIKLNKDKVKLISIANDRVTDAHYVTIGFLAKNFGGKAIVKEPDEIVDWKWFDVNKLPKNIYFPSKKLFENYLARKIYQK